MLAEGGPEAVSVEPLAESLGVTKGGFYWHFKNRGALLAELLDAWEEMSVDVPVRRVEEDERRDPREELRVLFSLADRQVLEVDLAVRDWARRDQKVARRLRRVDDRRMGFLRERFAAFVADPDEVEVRCLLTFSLWIGNHFVAAKHEGRRRSQVLGLAMEHLLA
jgi:AcrR family transcriptional regulator